jgi:hypothetical protein
MAYIIYIATPQEIEFDKHSVSNPGNAECLSINDRSNIKEGLSKTAYDDEFKNISKIQGKEIINMYFRSQITSQKSIIL